MDKTRNSGEGSEIQGKKFFPDLVLQNRGLLKAEKYGICKITFKMWGIDWTPIDKNSEFLDSDKCPGWKKGLTNGNLQKLFPQKNIQRKKFFLFFLERTSSYQ